MATLGARAHGSMVLGAGAPLPLGVMPPRSSMGAIPATLTGVGLRWSGVGDMGPAWNGGTHNGGGGGGCAVTSLDRLAHLRSLETMASNASLALVSMGRQGAVSWCRAVMQGGSTELFVPVSMHTVCALACASVK